MLEIILLKHVSGPERRGLVARILSLWPLQLLIFVNFFFIQILHAPEKLHLTAKDKKTKLFY
jgi:hypothetical protein